MFRGVEYSSVLNNTENETPGVDPMETINIESQIDFIFFF